jgi:hypothetical protein
VPLAHWDEVILARTDVKGLQVNPAVPVSYARVYRAR